MATTYTSLLGLALPTTGELQGTWGDTVNNSITSLLDSAVAGTTTLSTDGDVTLTTTTGAANQARQAILLCSGARTAQRTITAPAQSKIYTVINATSGGFAVKLVGVGPTTGVTIPAGSSGMFAWNGSDFVDVSNYVNGNKIINGNLTVNGNTTLGDASGDSLTINAGTVTLNQGTANGVAYLNGSKVLTTGSALTFDGSRIALSTATSNIQLTTSVNTNQAYISLADADGRTAVFRGPNSGSPNAAQIGTTTNHDTIFLYGGSEAMRLTSTSLYTASGINVGIGTSSPAGKLTVDPGNTSGTQIDGLRLPKNYTAQSNFVAWQQGANGWRVGIPYNDNTYPLAFYYGASTPTASSPGTQLMTLDASGNLGLGVTPSAWSGAYKAIEFPGISLANLNSGTNQQAQYLLNAYDSSAGAWKYKITGVGAAMYRQSADGSHEWHRAASGTAGNAITFTQAMTLDASGNLLVGTTTANNAKFAVNAVPNGTIGNQSAFIAGSKSGYAGYAQLPQGQLFVYDNTGSSSGTGGAISFGGDSGSGQQTWYAAIEARKDNSTSGDYGAAMVFYTRPSGTVAGERMRIDSSGKLLVGTTSAYNSAKLSVLGDAEIRGNIRSYLASRGGLASGGTVTLWSIPAGSFGSEISMLLYVAQRDDNTGALSNATYQITGFAGGSVVVTTVTSGTYGAQKPFTVTATAASGGAIVTFTNISASASTSVNMAAQVMYGYGAITWGF